MREPYPDDDGTMIRECRGCAGEYAIRTDEALESAGLVGEGCPWATVQQMAEDMALAEYDTRQFAMSRPGYEGFPPKRTQPGAVRSKMQLGLRIGELEAELAQVKAGWAEDDARLQRAEEGWAEASEQLAQVKAERDRWEELAGIECERYLKAVAERDTALRHLQAVLEWSNTERFAGRTRHEDDAPSAARAFLLSMSEGSNP